MGSVSPQAVAYAAPVLNARGRNGKPTDPTTTSTRPSTSNKLTKTEVHLNFTPTVQFVCANAA